MNVGKIFEKDFAESATKQGIFCHRLKDTDIAFNNNGITSYTPKNPCDYFLFANIDNKKGNLYAIECKTTKYMSMSIEVEKEQINKKMIKYHQIESLIKMSFYEGIHAGFVLNFRDEERGLDDTYYMSIRDFVNFLDQTQKKSINKMDCELRGIKLSANKKRIHYEYDILKMIKDIDKKGSEDNGESNV